MKMFKFLLTLAIACLSLAAVSQTGKVRGTIIDGETGETLPGVNVVVDGTTNGTVSDLDGKFNLPLEPGTYNIRFSFISFESQLIQDIVVSDGTVTNLNSIQMETDSEELQEVVISATMARDNEMAMLTLKKKSANMIDAVSSANFKKVGDSDAAASVKRVPGVSVEGGKYIYVRGLSDRYTKTLLNGFDIPGLDPDRNTIQMDLFPTSVLDNIVVNKTFIASLPADFTGGAINISTKEFPDDEQGGISVSLGYNPSFHFNNDYLTYNGSSTDLLGYDNGKREILIEDNIPQFGDVLRNPNGEIGSRYKSIIASFNPDMAAFKQRSFMDYGIGANYGNQRKLGDKYTLGYNFVLSYKNETSYFENVEYGRYGLLADPSINEMEVRELQTGSYGVNNVLLSGMAGIAIKTAKSKIKLNLLHIQNGESKAGIFDYLNSDQGAIFNGFQHNLEYSERSMTNLLVGGEHYFSDSKWSIDWGISPTLSVMNDPDIRFTRYEIRNDDFIIGTEAGLPQRIWRDLQEVNVSTKAEAAKAIQIFGDDGKFSFGGGYTYKERDYNIRSFNVNVRNLELTGDPDELFIEENLWPYGDNISQGTTIDATFLPTNPNEFNARVFNTASFASLDFKLFGVLKSTVGLRIENYSQRYTGQDQSGANVLEDDLVLESTDLFPTLNMAYQIRENQNLRFSYTQTIARPSLKELSYAEIYDPLTGRTFIGSLLRDADDEAGIVYWDGNLVSTNVHNLDLRWEIFPTASNTISTGVFYKYFINPIEIVQFATLPGAFQPRNVGDGQVYGAEIEIRTNLGLISENLNNYSFNANVTGTISQIEYSATEKESRDANARSGQSIGNYRTMAGQAPLIINAGISYDGEEEGFARNLQVGVYYNVQSSTLIYVGIVDRPDIYSVPFHSLNLNATKKFGSDDRMQVSLNVSNILGSEREEVFKSYKASDKIFTRFNPGQAFSIGFSYSF